MTTLLPSTSTPAPAVPHEQLAARTTGPVVVRGHAGYDALVQPWNLAIPVLPDAVLAARTDDDVVEAVRFARAHGLQVTPQATGHGPMASLVGQILVDTKGLDECVVHPEGWARVGAGVKWLRVVEAPAPHGLAPLSGSITDVGVVGYTTGGGLGPMARTHGLASDRVRAFEVVTGDGLLRRVTPTEHPELFFGLRGGKGMLGIVTAVEFDLVRQPTFYGGSLWFDGADAPAVLHRWKSWSDQLPTVATTSFAVFQLPTDDPTVPPPLAGRTTVSIRYVWTGDDDEGARWFEAMRNAGPVILDDVATKPYTAIDSVHTDPLDPIPTHEAGTVLRDLPLDAVDTLIALTGAGTQSPQILVEVRQLGGAVGDERRGASAFCSRGEGYSLLLVGIAGTPGLHDHGRAVLDAMTPWSGTYRLPNFSFSPKDLAVAYDPPTIARLRAAMRTYDPDRVMALGRVLDLD